MTNLNEQRKIALLEATLREILRLQKVAESSTTAISFDDIFDSGREARQWEDIMKKAAKLV